MLASWGIHQDKAQMEPMKYIEFTTHRDIFFYLCGTKLRNQCILQHGSKGIKKKQIIDALTIMQQDYLYMLNAIGWNIYNPTSNESSAKNQTWTMHL